MEKIEKEKFSEMMAALSIEEQMIAVSHFEESIMFAELQSRSRRKDAVITVIGKALEGGGLNVR